MVTEQDFAEANRRLEQAKELLWEVEEAVLDGHLDCDDFMLRNAITMCKSAPSALGALVSRVNKVKQEKPMSEHPYWNQFFIQMGFINHNFCTEELKVLFKNLSNEEFKYPHLIPTTYEAYLLCDLEEIAGKEFEDLLDAAEEFGGGNMIAHHESGPTIILRIEDVDNYKTGESDEE